MVLMMLKDETICADWKVFLEEHYKSAIETIALEYPSKQTLTIDFVLLDKADSSLADLLIDQPFKALYNAREAIKEMDTSIDEKLNLEIRIANLNEMYPCIPPNKLRAEHLGNLLSIEGFVRKATSPAQKMMVGAFQCNKCGAVIRVEQDEMLLKEPSECYEGQGGCGRVSSFKLLTNLSTLKDWQKIRIQEPPEDVKLGNQPEKIDSYVLDELVQVVIPGDRVIFTGVLLILPKRIAGQTSTVFSKYFDVNHITVKQTAYTSVDVSDDEKQQIINYSKSPRLHEMLRNSIAPSVYGYENLKNTLVVQLFGSDTFTHMDGTFRRGDSHILIVGDPGTAKSVFLEATYLLAPRAIFIEGPQATGAGLTTVAVKDDFGEGQWTIEAGALPQADLGMACIDEFEKMDSNDRAKIHRAMEQQKVTATKAGLNVTLNARCSILAAANPQDQSFTEYEPIAPQIDLPPTILSRFDYIFTLVDKPNAEKDMKLAKHIISSRIDPKSVAPEIPLDMFKKYIAYAKDKHHPIITKKIKEKTAEYYKELRQKYSKEDENLAETITPRQLETILRSAGANARLFLRDKILLEDVEYAVKLMDGAYASRGLCQYATNQKNWPIKDETEAESSVEKIK